MRSVSASLKSDIYEDLFTSYFYHFNDFFFNNR